MIDGEIRHSWPDFVSFANRRGVGSAVTFKFPRQVVYDIPRLLDVEIMSENRTLIGFYDKHWDQEQVEISFIPSKPGNAAIIAEKPSTYDFTGDNIGVDTGDRLPSRRTLFQVVLTPGKSRTALGQKLRMTLLSREPDEDRGDVALVCAFRFHAVHAKELAQSDDDDDYEMIDGFESQC